MNSEDIWRAARYLNEAAERASSAADRLEEAQRRLTYMFEDGYGGNALRLIELLEEEVRVREEVVGNED